MNAVQKGLSLFQAKKRANNACTRQVGVCAFFSLLRGFKFFPLPSRVHARPLAGNAGR